MKDPKQYLDTLYVGGEITSTGLDKVLAAMKAFAHDYAIEFANSYQPEHSQFDVTDIQQFEAKQKTDE